MRTKKERLVVITIDIGGIYAAVDNKYEYIAMLAADYLTDERPDFTVSVDMNEISLEREKSEYKNLPDAYFESIVAYRKIAEILPTMDAFVFHGSVLAYGGKAYILTAKSGVGKTTHTRLWLSEFGENCHVLNGDKPVIRYKDGSFFACGTPWRGKEMYGIHETLPLGGIAFLERGKTNRTYRISVSEATQRLAVQAYKPRERMAAIKSLLLIDRVLSEVSLVRLECNMEPDAAHVSRAALVDGIFSEVENEIQ